ncbi:MAG: hypothetical protein HY042_11910 [Spirochaetia bacterium]|nr:hypothetical protein [Spirochaetia bacterium]
MEQVFSRRSFLKASLLFGGAALATAGATRFLPRHHHGKLLSLNGYLADILYALAEVTLPGNGMPTAEEAGVIQRTDEEITFVSEQIRSDLKAALYFVEVSPLTGGYFGRFSRLTPSERLAFLRAGETGSSDLLRSAISNLRMVILLVYYGHKSTWKKIGYDGPFAGFPEKLSEQRVLYAKETA